MLSIYFGDYPKAIYDTNMYFRNTFQPRWLEDELAKKMIKAVDKSTVIDDEVIESKALGKISPFQLSGGVKTLLLMRNFPESVFNASTCGDNCSRWIMRMARETDLTINLRHAMRFETKRLEVRILNDVDGLGLDKGDLKVVHSALGPQGIVHSALDLAIVAGYCLGGAADDRII